MTTSTPDGSLSSSSSAAGTSRPVAAHATLIVVSFRTLALDLTWVPDDAPVIIAHNDCSLAPDRVDHPGVLHLCDRKNIGFGPAVNAALPHVVTSRVVLVNPDTTLSAEHWKCLSSGGPHEIVVVPLIDRGGVPTSMVNRYPIAPSLLLTALRAGRVLGRANVVRNALLPLLGAWGRQHKESLRALPASGSWPASTHWPCGAACSYPTELLRTVGGFDPGYFLYLEDIDLVRRMATVEPGLRIVQPDVSPGIHDVSSSSRGSAGRRLADLERARSAQRYARSQVGAAWRVSALIAGALARIRARTTVSSRK